MNTTRAARKTAHRNALTRIRQQRRSTRAARRIRNNGTGTLTQYGMATGLTHRDAASMASTMRTTARKLNIQPATIRVHAGRRMRDAAVYTPAQTAAICTAYKPRKSAFKAAAAQLRLAA